MNTVTIRYLSCIVMFACVALLTALAPSGPPYELSWYTMDTGGGTSTGGIYEVSGTVGQPDPEIVTGGIYELTGGFWSAFDTLPCPADTNGDGFVNVPDLLDLLNNWGACPAPCPPDTNDDGFVNVPDLLLLLNNWGTCP